MKKIAVFVQKPILRSISKILTFLESSMMYKTNFFDYSDKSKDFLVNCSFDIIILIGYNSRNIIHQRLHTILMENNKNQKIIEIQEKDTKCNFDKTCNECLNRNYISIKELLNLNTLVNLIENFDENVCQVLANKNIIQHLNHINYFKHLDQKSLKTLQDNTLLRTFEKNSIIFYEGDEIKYFYFLLTGHLKQYDVIENGNTIILRQFNTPSFICEDESYHYSFFNSNLETLTKCDILFIEKEFFIKLLNKDTVLLSKIFVALIEKIQFLKSHFTRNNALNVEYQVAVKLAQTPDLFKFTKKSHLADDLNIAPETLSRVLNKFKKLHILNRKNEILDFEKLKLITSYKR